MARIRIAAEELGWKPKEDKNKKRLREEFVKMCQALAEDEKERRARPRTLRYWQLIKSS